jgi:AcrR family transcriptional regulator
MSKRTGPAADRRRREVSREEILRVAADLFHAQGYRATSLEQVAEHFGVQRPAIYYYFRNKAAILIEIHNSALQELTEQLDEICALDVAPDEKLERVLRGQVGIYTAKVSALAVFLENEAELPASEAQHARREKRRYNDALEQIYREGVGQGLFADLDPRIVNNGLNGLTGWMSRWYDPEGEYDAEQIADILIALVRDGFSAKTG